MFFSKLSEKKGHLFETNRRAARPRNTATDDDDPVDGDEDDDDEVEEEDTYDRMEDEFY
jgi:hypothetical protein